MVVESSISSRNIRNWNKLISIEVEGNVVKRLSIDYEGADPELLYCHGGMESLEGKRSVPNFQGAPIVAKSIALKMEQAWEELKLASSVSVSDPSSRAAAPSV
ncbi:hypothetical protein RHMOL_Rhmol07G0078800 [Rhododendron molle]|uniref:Uncharacterized protein n=1 Tax=Rhododendron molle TaxID=49168 RepID=A0ACC0MYI5_RHOML|nr:hypothetical protein RHMOL_Rhmol07G0078800 [Rhododendron molle]